MLVQAWAASSDTEISTDGNMVSKITGYLVILIYFILFGGYCYFMTRERIIEKVYNWQQRNIPHFIISKDYNTFEKFMKVSHLVLFVLLVVACITWVIQVTFLSK